MDSRLRHRRVAAIGHMEHATSSCGRSFAPAITTGTIAVLFRDRHVPTGTSRHHGHSPPQTQTGGGSPRAEVTTDHKTIRQWAERQGGKPAAVDRTHKGDDVGIIRIMFPNAPNSEHGNLVEISWDEFFTEFEERNLALVYDPSGLFSKIVGRDTAERREHGDHRAARHSGDGNGGGRSEDRAQGSDDDSSLKQREYRDSDGTVHHHTKAYMEQHSKKG